MSEDPLLAHLLLRLNRWFDHGVVNLMEARGHAAAKRSHGLVMRNIDERGVSESEIARRAGVSRQAVHQVVQELRALGQVEVRADARDRRLRVVVPTEDGRAAIRDALEVLRLLEEELTARISPEHVAALRAALAVDPGPAPCGEPLAAAEHG